MELKLKKYRAGWNKESDETYFLASSIIKADFMLSNLIFTTQQFYFENKFIQIDIIKIHLKRKIYFELKLITVVSLLLPLIEFVRHEVRVSMRTSSDGKYQTFDDPPKLLKLFRWEFLLLDINNFLKQSAGLGRLLSVMSTV